LINLKTRPRTQSGFTYIGLLILIAVMGVTLAGTGTIWRTTQQRLHEQQLLFVGNQFSRAITAYYVNSPDGIQQFPKKLEDLLIDKRYPNTQRYLRKIFADPITGKNQWGLIKAADGGIVGVRSLSELVPIKQEGFGKGNEAFAGKKHYSEWQFTYRPNGFAAVLQNAVLGTMPAKPVLAPVPVPPPPLPPSLANANISPRLMNLCQIIFSTDVMNCSNLGVKFGDAAKNTCMESANERYFVCLGKDPGASMPILDVQYE
jgi:type II secretory pathway pseudopilin PulG